MSQAYERENFFCMSMPKIISVSGSLLQIIKLWVNLNSAMLKCKAIIPRAVIGEPSAVQFCCSGLYGGLVTVLNVLIDIVLEYNMAAPESINAL